MTDNASSIWPQKQAQRLIHLACLAYDEQQSIQKSLGTEVEWFEAIGGFDLDTQAFACEIDGDVYVAFRGTEQWRDFLTDLSFWKADILDYSTHTTNLAAGTKSVGRAHIGFCNSLDAIWSKNSAAYKKCRIQPSKTLEQYLGDSGFSANSRIWLTGHSLGGALATIAAARIQLSENEFFKDRVGGLVTIGSPRALAYKTAVRLQKSLSKEKIFRIYRTFDPVPAVPRLGFKHVSGERCVVGNGGELVVGARKSRFVLGFFAKLLRNLEDIIGSAIPGQRKIAGLVADHDKFAYFEAVKGYVDGQKMHAKPLLKQILASGIKLAIIGLGALGSWSAWG